MRHDEDSYGDFHHFEVHTDGSTLTLVCTECPPDKDDDFEDLVIMEWWSLPVVLAELVKEASKHEVEMDRLGYGGS